MRAPKEILQEIILVIIYIVSLIVMNLIFMWLGLFEKTAQNEPKSYWVFLIFIPTLLLASKSTKWMMIGIERITGFQFTFGWLGFVFMFTIGGFLSIIIIPIGLSLLIAQYLRARKQESI